MRIPPPFVILFVGLGIAPSLTACEDTLQQKSEAPPPSVIVVSAQRQAVSNQTEFVGRIRAVDRVEVRARIEGLLKERTFREGQMVEANALLFRIEPDRFKAQVQLAVAQVARAKARKNEADKTLRRSQSLIKKKAVSQAKLEEAEAEAQTTAAEVLAAEAELQQARINLAYTEIHSPIAGRVGKVAYSAGNLINPASGVLTIVTKVDPVYVDFSISERAMLEAQRRFTAAGGQGDLREAERKSEVQLRLPDGELYDFVGSLKFLSAEVDPLTGSVPIRAEFRNSDGLLLHGQFVTVVLRRQLTSDKIVLPQTAIQEDQAGTFVLVVDKQNQVQIRRIEAGQAQGTSRVIEQGLEEGEVVVVAGVQKVRPGVAVKPVFRDGKQGG
jgi:membrane fusion protein (multidrug efflux system)